MVFNSKIVHKLPPGPRGRAVVYVRISVRIAHPEKERIQIWETSNSNMRNFEFIRTSLTHDVSKVFIPDKACHESTYVSTYIRTYVYVILSIKKSRSNTVRIPWLRRSGAVGGGGGPLGGQCRRLAEVPCCSVSSYDARTKTTTIRRLVGPAASYLADRRLHVWYFTRFSMSSWSLRLRWGSSRQVSHVFSELLWLAIVIPCQW